MIFARGVERLKLGVEFSVECWVKGKIIERVFVDHRLHTNHLSNSPVFEGTMVFRKKPGKGC